MCWQHSVSSSGVRLGRPNTVPQAVVRRIQLQRTRGDTLRKIADDLNEARVPTLKVEPGGYCGGFTNIFQAGGVSRVGEWVRRQ